ncbi:hypothetical protein LIER_33829 [Lithospermum erythrorhizon]|uniref:Reverse transcriptase domain-containing protein n=1 Tax=Lithospermum erythrorhizon TaxID=34254 RepID=A0AAV3S2P1_LITER
MCTDFTNFNKACPKDLYPPPCLGRLVDRSAGHELFDFMDASRRYHQIRMLPEDEEKITFITNIKAQELANFVIEGATCQPPQVSGAIEPLEPPKNPEWVVYVNGARNSKGSGREF